HDSVADRQHWDQTYDYIVVGAGSAGSVVAHRLVDECKTKILLLEAGGAQSVDTDIPQNARSLLNTEYNCRYHTVPQKWFTPYRVPVPRGRGIGGSSTINNMVYSRGNRQDYDRWVTEFGAYGWSYEEMLSYFVKSENNTDSSVVATNTIFHGTGGPVKVFTDPNPDPLLRVYNDVLNSELGLPNTDINGPNQLGVTIAQSFIYEGIRQSTGNAYLTPNPWPDKLHILTNAYVTRVLFSEVKKKWTAIGVEFSRNGRTYHVMANKEVILSAGTFGSAKILMLSGIGPRDHLTQLGIPVLVNLPVGDYLRDHPSVSIHMTVDDKRLDETGAQLTVQQLYEELVYGRGPLSVLTNSVYFWSTQSNADKCWPNTYTYSTVEVLVLKIFSYLSIHELIGLERVSKQFQFCANYLFRHQKTLSFKPKDDVIPKSYSFPLRYLETHLDGKLCLISNAQRILWLSQKLPNIEYLGISHFTTDYKTLYDILKAFQSVKWLDIRVGNQFTGQQYRQLGQLLSGRVTTFMAIDCYEHSKNMDNMVDMVRELTQLTKLGIRLRARNTVRELFRCLPQSIRSLQVISNLVDLEMAEILVANNGKHLDYLFICNLTAEALQLIVNSMALNEFSYDFRRESHEWQRFQCVAQKQPNLRTLRLIANDFKDYKYTTNLIQFSNVKTFAFCVCKPKIDSFISLLKCFSALETLRLDHTSIDCDLKEYKSAAFSPIAMEAAVVSALIMLGITEASATRRPPTCLTRRRSSTTTSSRWAAPIRH
ncbi:unnamed protein product, partial [Medioppia subpectinata]